MLELQYLVVSTGRCGSVFAARLLTSLGISCGHEAIFSPKGQNEALNRLKMGMPKNSHCSENDCLNRKPLDKWLFNSIIADSSFMAVPFIDKLNAKIIHIYRNPLEVVSSFHKDANFFDKKNKFFVNHRDIIYNTIPEIKGYVNHLEKCVVYYLKWNELIEEQCKNKIHIKGKVEDLPNQQLFDFLNIPTTENYFNDTKINTWKKRKTNIKFKDIKNKNLRRQLEDIYDRYGYNKKLFI